MQEAATSCKEAQDDELLALEAIHEHGVSVSRRHDGPTEVTLSIEIQFDEPIDINLKGKGKAQDVVVRLQFLSPLTLVIVLPAAYPDQCAPIISNIDSPWSLGRDQSVWHDKLKHDLNELWQGDVCLDLFMDYTRDLVMQPSQLEVWADDLNELHAILAAHDAKRRAAVFSGTSFACGICLEDRKGKGCVQLTGCSHVFCFECLAGYFRALIAQGIVRTVHCPDPACVRDRAKAQAARPSLDAILAGAALPAEADLPGDLTRSELVQLVGDSLHERYVWLVKKQQSESDPSTTYCPIESCQAAVPADPNQLEIYEKLRICPTCQFSFCVFCRRTWHGTSQTCLMSKSNAIVQQYLDGDDAVKARLELQYGARNMQRLVKLHEEQRANQEYLDATTTACPECSIPIEKSEGCSHMLCNRCRTHFCFRCGSKLSASDPYLHFQMPGPCFHKLFDFQPSAAEEEAMAAQWMIDEM
ncbi:uncharacterized protein L969DRAFT_86399 [Mixia osmundae IAM 14324]|uniref:uncharacterized protein n=1 Tax=Mixia osmundae (strain CBS 9802 / IAM 14324 / JCM 22182 / KY 12970) TaxID=764103 RepID=UPI0004A55045|nr:uncharacterized protein L969DRAFT_86399 [Mixia osmundae IAM 14324]KEI39815.1 hypothetical protein L969DRAFT_86399 [Mixia osmundae IAM 14324]